MPRRPDIPDELELYVDADRGDPRYKVYPLDTRSERLLTFLSRARWGALITTALLYIATTLLTFFLGGQPITWDNALRALLPTRIQEWWSANSLLVLGIAVVIALIIVVALILGARAQATLDRAERVNHLRVEWARWKQDTVLWSAAHEGWQRTRREAHTETERLAAKVDEALAGVKGAESLPERRGPPFDTLAAPDDEHFIGRTQDIQWVLDHLSAGGIVALTGQPGIGKSALAGVVIRHVPQRFPDGIAVTPCNTLTDPIEVLRNALTRFDPYRRPPHATDLAGMHDAAGALLRGKRALVALDNVEPGLPLADVVALLRSVGATVLLTARQSAPVSAVPADRSHLVGLLPPELAEDLFASIYGRDSAGDLSAMERAAVQRIVVNDLGRHTLAITVVAAYAKDAGRNLGELAQELADPTRVFEIAGDDETPEAVKRAFALSLDMLPADARRLFAALGAFTTAEFGRNAALALAARLAPPATEADLDLLARRSLSQVITDTSMPADTDRERITLHPLVWALAVSELKQSSDDDQSAAQSAVAAYYAGYANATADVAIAPDEENIVGALQWSHTRGENELVARLCNGMQYYWRTRGRVPVSLSFLPWGVEAADAVLGDKPADGGDANLMSAWKSRASRAFWLRLNLGFAYQIAGRLSKAADHYEQCLALARRAGSLRNEGAAISVLGQIAQRRGKLDEADAYFQQSLVIRREVQDRQGEGVVLAQLGLIARDTGQFDAAEDYFLQCLAIMREVQDALNQARILEILGAFLIERRGNSADGCKMLHEAARLYDEMGVPGGEEARESARRLGCGK